MLNDDVLDEIVSLVDQVTTGGGLPAYPRFGKPGLTKLRLVNKAFCRVVSPRLFRTVSLFTQYRLPSVEQLYDMISSELAVYVHNLVIPLPLADRSYRIDNLKNYRLFIEDLATLFPISLASFRNLKTISVRCDHDGCHRTIFTNALRHQFDSCLLTALRYSPLRQLTSLHLQLLAAEDFNQLLLKTQGTQSLSSLMSRLQHLSVSFVDRAGRQGGYRQSPSYIQEAYPNARYECQFFEFISLAKNLRSLAIECAEYFDLDHLNLSSLQKLDSMELTCVKVKASTLLSLLSPAFQHLILNDVQLKSGTWHTVFRHLYKLPTLVAFQVVVLAYSLRGESAQYRLGLLPPMDDPQELESLCFEDHYALRDLKVAVEKRREDAGLPPWQY